MPKPRTKANGEGTIYVEERNGKKYYRAQITIGYDEKGRLKRKSFSGYVKKEVIEKMNEYLYKMNTGQISDNENITLQEWFYTWLFEFRIHDLKPSSFERYESIYRNYIEGSPIGKMKLKDLRAANIQAYYNALLEKDISISTLHTINKFLKTCLNEAVKQNYIPQNYCNSVKLPKETKTESYDVFTLEEQEKFLQAIKGHKYELAFKLNLGTGLRLGELLALKWTDIDFINNTVSVNKSIKRVTFVDKDGNRENKIIEQTPKTKTSYRTVPIPENIMKELKTYMKKQYRFKKDNEFYNDNDYIFCDEFGNPLDPKLLPRNFKSILKKAGLREIKYHSLRHTYATRLFEAGVPIKTVQALLGHSDISTTMNIYTHVMPEQKSIAAERINNLFGVQ